MYPPNENILIYYLYMLFNKFNTKINKNSKNDISGPDGS